MILSPGKDCYVRIKGAWEEATPYVSTTAGGGQKLVGLGIRVHRNDQLLWYHTPGPYACLVNLLAAQFVLEELPAYSETVLRDALLFATEVRKGDSEPNAVQQTILDLLGGDQAAYDELRERVRTYQPGINSFSVMLNQLLDQGIPINTQELYDLVEQKMLVYTPYIELCDRLRVAREEGFETWQEFLDAPLEHDNWSLADYLSTFGIQTLVQLVPDDMVGTTFERRYDVSETDWKVKAFSTLTESEPLRLFRVSSLFGTGMRERTVPITVTDNNGDQYILVDASYRNGVIYVSTKVRLLNGESSTLEYTVAHLRLWVQPPSKPRKAWLQLTSK